VIQQITGIAATTCPWRAYYDPLVRDVVAVWWSTDKGNLGAVLGDDPPAVLVDALGVFGRSLSATQAEDARLASEKRKADSEARQARRGR
jgi:hypothetical protein